MNNITTIENKSNFEKLVFEIAAEEDISKPEITYKYGQVKGDGYIGVVNAVEITGENKSLGLIVKTSPGSDELRKQAPIRDVFLREIFTYNKILPAFASLQKSAGCTNPFKATPRCYKTVDTEKQEMLILENLKNSGFDVWDRKQPMDAQHMELVFKEYGRFHAVSFAMRDQNKGLYDELTKDLDEVFLKSMAEEKLTEMLDKVAEDIKSFFDPVEDRDLLAVYDGFAKGMLDYMWFCTKGTDRSVIIHGDCWCNNMMFKYNDPTAPKTPSDMRLIDFQITRNCSPVLDLTYFACACCPKQLLDNYQHYLQVYHRSLSEHLRSLGSDPDLLFPYAALEDEWKTYGKYGVIMASFIIKMMLSDSDEAPDMSATVEAGEQFLEAFNFDIKNQAEFARRIRDVVRCFYENDLL